MESDHTWGMWIWGSLPIKLLPFPVSYDSPSTFYHGYQRKEIIWLIRKKVTTMIRQNQWSLFNTSCSSQDNKWTLQDFALDYTVHSHTRAWPSGKAKGWSIKCNDIAKTKEKKSLLAQFVFMEQVLSGSHLKKLLLCHGHCKFPISIATKTSSCPWKVNSNSCLLHRKKWLQLAYLETRLNHKIHISRCQKGISITVTAI